MVDVARLAVAVDSSDLASGKTALRGFANEGKRTETQIVKSADRMERELAQTAVAAQSVSKGFNSNSLRMASMQLSQVGQQTMATGNFVQALAIQLPDLALGLGTVGILAGVAAGVLLPLAVNFVKGGEGAEDFQDALDGLHLAISEVTSANEVAGTSLEDLSEQFGENARQVRDNAVALRDLAAVKAIGALQETVRSLAGDIAGAVAEFDRLENLSGNNARNVQRHMAALTAETGLTADEARKVSAAFNELSRANGLEQTTQAAQTLFDQMVAVFGSAQQIPPELQEAARRAIETANAGYEIEAALDGSSETAGRAADATNVWAGAMGGVRAELNAIASIISSLGGGAITAAAKRTEIDALRAGNSIKDAARAAAEFKENLKIDAQVASLESKFGKVGTAMGSVLRGQVEYNRELDRTLDAERDTALEREKAAAKAAVSSASGGGGGSSAASKAAREAQRAQNDLNRDAERIIEGLKDEQEKYNDSLEQAKRLLDAGVLSQEQYNQHVAQLGQELRDQQPFVQEWKDSVIDAAMGGADAFDSLRDAIIRAGLEYALFGTGQFAPKGGASGGGGGGGLLGGLFGSLLSFDGGGYTGGGSRTGGMDGKGGMLAMVHPQETITDHTKGQTVGGGVVEVRVVGGDLMLSDNGSIMARVQVMDAQNVQKAVGASQDSFRKSKQGWSP